MVRLDIRSLLQDAAIEDVSALMTPIVLNKRIVNVFLYGGFLLIVTQSAFVIGGDGRFQPI